MKICLKIPTHISKYLIQIITATFYKINVQGLPGNFVILVCKKLGPPIIFLRVIFAFKFISDNKCKSSAVFCFFFCASTSSLYNSQSRKFNKTVQQCTFTTDGKYIVSEEFLHQKLTFYLTCYFCYHGNEFFFI